VIIVLGMVVLSLGVGEKELEILYGEEVQVDAASHGGVQVVEIPRRGY